MNFFRRLFNRPPPAEYQVIDPNGLTIKASEDAPYSVRIGHFQNTANEWSKMFTIYAEEGYEGNPTVHAAIMYKAKSGGMAPRRVFTGERNMPEFAPDTDPINVLLQEPNAFMSGLQLAVLEHVYFNLAGNSFTFIERGANNEPVGLWPMRPDHVDIVHADGVLIGYAYRAGFNNADRLPILLEDMIHVKLPNPTDVLEGMGEGFAPLGAAALDGDVSNSLSVFLKNFVKNGVMPAALLTHDGKLTERNRNAIQRQWRERYGGAENWGELAVIDSTVTYQRISLLLNEIQMDHLDKRSEIHLCAVLGISPMLIPTLVQAGKNIFSGDGGFESIRRAFWEDTMLFDLRLFASVYSNRLLPDNPIENIIHDISAVPAFRVDIVGRSSAAKTMYDMGMPANQALMESGIVAEPFEGGDIPFGGQVMFSASMSSGNNANDESDDDNGESAETGDNEDIEGNESDDDEETLALPAPMNIEQLSAVRSQFDLDFSAVDALLSMMIERARNEKRSWQWTDIVPEVEAYYDTVSASAWIDASPNHHKKVRKHCADVMIVGLTAMNRENFTLSRGRKAIKATFGAWSDTIARDIVGKQNADILFQEGDTIIDEDDVDRAIADAGDVSQEFEEMLNAEIVEEM